MSSKQKKSFKMAKIRKHNSLQVKKGEFYTIWQVLEMIHIHSWETEFYRF